MSIIICNDRTCPHFEHQSKNNCIQLNDVTKCIEFNSKNNLVNTYEKQKNKITVFRINKKHIGASAYTVDYIMWLENKIKKLNWCLSDCRDVIENYNQHNKEYKESIINTINNVKNDLYQ